MCLESALVIREEIQLRKKIELMTLDGSKSLDLIVNLLVPRSLSIS